MIEISLGGDAYARSLRLSDAPALHALMTASRVHLDRWLRWSSSIQTLADVEALIQQFMQKEAAGDGFHLGV